jgi:hypothetical protein
VLLMGSNFSPHFCMILFCISQPLPTGNPSQCCLCDRYHSLMRRRMTSGSLQHPQICLATKLGSQRPLFLVLFPTLGRMTRTTSSLGERGEIARLLLWPTPQRYAATVSVMLMETEHGTFELREAPLKSEIGNIAS